jgi:hypothetical protein
MGEKWVNDDVGILADERLTLGARAYSKDFAKISGPMIKGTDRNIQATARPATAAHPAEFRSFRQTDGHG